MTPVLLHAARRRAARRRPLPLRGGRSWRTPRRSSLPGSNLTNLIVLAHEHIVGCGSSQRGSRPPVAAAVALTIAFVALVFRARSSRPAGTTEHVVAFRVRALAAVASRGGARPRARPPGAPRARARHRRVARSACRRARRAPRREPAPAARRARRGGRARRARARGRPSATPRARRALGDGWVAAGAAVLVNNLPAAVMLSRICLRTRARCCSASISGRTSPSRSLSAVLWHQVATAEGARPSIVRYTLVRHRARAARRSPRRCSSRPS